MTDRESHAIVRGHKEFPANENGKTLGEAIVKFAPGALCHIGPLVLSREGPLPRAYDVPGRISGASSGPRTTAFWLRADNVRTTLVFLTNSEESHTWDCLEYRVDRRSQYLRLFDFH
jgi:hypothetical protein